jgi:hypothetical protein
MEASARTAAVERIQDLPSVTRPGDTGYMMHVRGRTREVVREMRPLKGILVIVAGAVQSGPVQACTSFVDYSSGSAWYGMNFDWHPETEILFRIQDDIEGSRCFTMSFDTPDGPVPTVGMTADGRFSTLQVTDAPWTGPPPDSGNSYIFWPFYALVYRGADMDDISELVASDTFVQYWDPPLHVMAADATGEAMIIEVGESGNEVLERTTEPFIVMTNFMCCAWRNASPALVRGCGADRYRAAWAVLRAGGVSGPGEGLDVLRAALSTSADFPTRASMVFDPSTGTVYIAPAGRFDRAWELDIASGRLAAWPEAPAAGELTMDSAGVTVTELLSGY